MNIQEILARNAINNGGTPGGLAPGANTSGGKSTGFSGFGGTKGRGLSGLSNTDIFGALGLLSGNGVASLALNAAGVALDQNSQSVAGHPDFGLANTSFSSGLANALSFGLMGESVADQATAQGFGDLAVGLNSHGALTTPDLASSIGFGAGQSSGFGLGDIDFGDVDMSGFGVDVDVDSPF